LALFTRVTRADQRSARRLATAPTNRWKSCEWPRNAPLAAMRLAYQRRPSCACVAGHEVLDAVPNVLRELALLVDLLREPRTVVAGHGLAEVFHQIRTFFESHNSSPQSAFLRFRVRAQHCFGRISVFHTAAVLYDLALLETLQRAAAFRAGEIGR